MKKVILLASVAIALSACQTTTPRHKQANLKGLDSSLYKAAKQAEDQGARKESLLFYEELYRRNSEDPASTLAYVKALRRSGDIDKAALILEAWQGKNVSLDVEYARILMMGGQIHDAELILEKHLKHAEAEHVMGVVLDGQGLHIEAEEHLRNALSKWEGSPVPVLNNLALNLAAQNKKDEALALIDRALVYNPQDHYLLKNRKLIAGLKKPAVKVSEAKAPAPHKKPENG